MRAPQNSGSKIAFSRAAYRWFSVAEAITVVTVISFGTFMPDRVAENDCPISTNSITKDFSKMTYFVMLPAVYGTLLLNRYYESKSNKTTAEKQARHLMLDRVLYAAQTLFFSTTLVVGNQLPQSLLLLGEAVAAWPIFSLLIHKFNEEFKQGSIAEMRGDADLSGSGLVAATLMEAASRGLRLGASLTLITNLLLDFTYLTSHGAKNWIREIQLIPFSLGALLGMASVCHKKLGKTVAFSDSLLSAFFFTLMPWVSIIYCKHYNDFNGQGFKTTGVGITIGLAIFALIESIPAAFYGMINPYEPTEESRWDFHQEDCDAVGNSFKACGVGLWRLGSSAVNTAGSALTHCGDAVSSAGASCASAARSGCASIFERVSRQRTDDRTRQPLLAHGNSQLQ